MIRLILTGLGFVVVMAGGFLFLSQTLGPKEPTDLASLDSTAGLHHDESKGFLKDVVTALPWVGGDEAPKTRGAALALRADLRRVPLRDYFPDAPEEWERLDWNVFFESKFGAPDNPDNIETESYVYLKKGQSTFLRAEFSEPTAPMVADLLQFQRYVERGGELSDIADQRPTIEHSIETVRATADGWSIASDMTFKHFAHVEGVSFIVGKPEPVFGQPNKLRFIYGALGGGVVLKVRSDASKDAILELLEGVDFNSLNHLQSVPHPLVGEGLPAYVIESPETWLSNRDYKLKKVQRVIPVKEELAEDATDDEKTKDKNDGGDKKKAKKDKYAKDEKHH